MANVKIDSPSEPGKLSTGRNTKMWINGAEVTHIKRIDVWYAPDEVVRVNAEIMPTGGFTIEADAHINIKLIAIRGHKVVATRRSESQVVYTVERVVDEDIQIEPGS